MWDRWMRREEFEGERKWSKEGKIGKVMKARKVRKIKQILGTNKERKNMLPL